VNSLLAKAKGIRQPIRITTNFFIALIQSIYLLL